MQFLIRKRMELGDKMNAKKIATLMFALAFSLLTQLGLAWFPETEYNAARQFVSCLGVSFDSGTSETNSWATPAFFVCQDEATNSVLVERTVPLPSGIRYVLQCSRSNETATATVNICTDQASAVTELCLPCVAFASAPVDMIATAYCATNHSSGVTQIMTINDKHESALLSYRNISIRFQGHDPYVRAVALLRAGGVEIPDEPAPQNPEPESGK